jgi:hypothetical protein
MNYKGDAFYKFLLTFDPILALKYLRAIESPSHGGLTMVEIKARPGIFSKN